MKTVRNFLSVLMLILLMSGVNSNLQAQGKGHDKKHDNSGRSKKENHSHKDRYNDSDKDRHHGDRYSLDDRRSGKYSLNDRRSRDYYASRRNDRHNYHGRYTTYNHHRNRKSYKWAPVYGHRYNTRYIYYRDYNVYYDTYNDVFVTWSGRNWIITSRVPTSIMYVDFRNTTVVGVDYWDDDFNFYLARRRPAYISISASF